MIRVLIADDQALVRAGLRAILESEPDIEVVGEADDGVQAIDGAVSLLPDLILMDIRMPNMDGIEATRRVLKRQPDVRVLMLTTFDHKEYLYDAVHAGASGFLLKNASPDHLVHAVRSTVAGEMPLDPMLTRRLLEEFAERPRPGARAPAQLDSLSNREIEVLRLVASGLSNGQIADRLVIAETTVKTHVGSILGKLNLHDRVQAAVLAYDSGLVTPGQHETA